MVFNFIMFVICAMSSLHHWNNANMVFCYMTAVGALINLPYAIKCIIKLFVFYRRKKYYDARSCVAQER